MSNFLNIRHLISTAFAKIVNENADFTMVVYFITGGCGFLGQHIVRTLLDRCPEVASIRIYDTHVVEQMSKWSNKIQLIRGDVTDREFLESAMIGSDVVVHAASLVDVWHKYSEDTVYQVNVGGTNNVLSCCVSTGVAAMVYTSSMEAVGPNKKAGDFVRGNETTPYKVHHEMAYSHSKERAEHLVKQYAGVMTKRGEPLRTCSLRPTGIYGENCPILKNFYKQAKKANGRIFGGTSENSEHGRVYAGNAAWMHIQAAKILLENNSRSTEMNGQAFFCYDGSPYMSYDRFTMVLLQDCDFALTTVPYSLMKGIAMFNDGWRKVSRKFGKKYHPMLNKYTLAVARTSFTVKTNKAFKMFGYEPLYSWYESLSRTREWVQTLDY
ncbi:3-beta-hydroxy-delta-5-C27-steroid oxidoreductase [Singapore grouper iridovirus]|uniref:3-beta-hydroxy-delta-5-C27-steroid oxidoreductase n=1 Tax=Singapore grouper iridovirus TaxID=262968 RepID=Q5YFR2_9VIRU|nr:3-beta-hydroxy-delta-5-C27-steroid oxidoreductase [Singapore grouper iridovirus]AAS18018.1 3-beta-hydroxy-delta-5-C27-steroid oxidoreductase [Singapore grouper iridovirus]WAU86712.1 3-beta-hydroxy-delta-5-C27-steroid oxidoreductase [Singapore grouper iridovirus]